MKSQCFSGDLREELRKKILERYKYVFNSNKSYNSVLELARDVYLEDNAEFIAGLIETIIELAEEQVINHEMP